ncbi:MAG TPA: hypothetical protein VM165_23720, partial [Planctomycetaceae bacterium]|nr:hypothetical protein [Planctomycetaceae bacterium]
KNGEPANDVEVIQLSNEERRVDLKERPLLPELDGSVLLFRDKPLGFTTGGRLAFIVRKKDGKEVPITIELPKAPEVEVVVP